MRRARKAAPPPGLTGTVRVGSTSSVLSRVQVGELAVIDHLDLDKVTADALVSRGAAAVVNASPSSSGRYPNLGPEILLRAGVPLVDSVGPEVLKLVRDGERLRLDGGVIYRGDEALAGGELATAERVQTQMRDARTGLASQLEAFAGDTTAYLRQESELILDGVGVPELTTRLRDRQVLVVVRAYEYAAELAALKSYIAEVRPVLVGVDGGADALLEAGYRPDLVVGDLEQLAETTLSCGAELVVHADRDGTAPGLERARGLGLTPVLFPVSGSAEDAALLLADVGGAALIAVAGTHASLAEFLDRGRPAMASTFLVRLRLGHRLVDARAVVSLHRKRTATWPVFLLAVLLLAVAVAVLVTSGPSSIGHDISSWWDSLVSSVTGST
jgi:uncharacterized membrane-anchored protein